MGGRIAALVLAVALLAGCSASGKAGTEADKNAAHGIATAADKDGADEPGAADRKEATGLVVLTAAEREKLGIATAPAQALSFTPAALGFGVVLDHEAVAQVAAELETATSAARLSQAALARGRSLATGPGALGIDTVEIYGKQASADQAALLLARRKLTALLGVRFPWRDSGTTGVLDALASGEAKLVRATFPAGTLSGGTPASLQMIPLEQGPQSAMWTADAVWDAPQDTNLPGRSFFAMLRKSDVPEGSRLQVLPVASGKGTQGVVVPAGAVVISDGRYWCYLEKSSGSFVRTPVDVSRPVAQGYFVSDGVAAGDRIVTSSAGLLLARQTNATSETAD